MQALASDFLSKQTLLASSDRIDVRNTVSHLLCEHDMEVGRLQRLQTRIGGFLLENTALLRVRYGADVLIRPKVTRDFYMIVLVLGGTGQSLSGDLSLAPGQVLAIKSRHTPVARLHADADHIVIRINRDYMMRTLARKLGYESTADIVFGEPEQPAGSSTIYSGLSRFLHGIDLLLSSFDRAGPANKDQMRAIEGLLASHVISTFPNNYSVLIQGGGDAWPVYLRRALEYMKSNCQHEITMQHLCEFCNVSARTLSGAFARHLRCSPAKYLKQLRMERIRRDLETPGESLTVTEIAARWNVYQLGRFSCEYRKAYGENPSVTRARARLRGDARAERAINLRLPPRRRAADA